MPFENSQGVKFTYGGTVYTATQIAVSRSRGEFDVSSTDLANNSFRRFRAGKINSVDVKVDWISEGSFPAVRTMSTFQIEGQDIGAADFSGKKALCTGMTITGNAGDLVRGSATFRVSQD